MVAAYSEINLTIAANEQVPSVIRRGLNDTEMGEDEQMQFFTLLGQFLTTWSVMYDLYAEGQLPETQWVVIRKDIISAFTTPGGRRFFSPGP